MVVSPATNVSRARWNAREFALRRSGKRAHESAQQDEGVEGSWVHAYLHRKEGDQGNAAYWYTRAGFADNRLIRNGSASWEFWWDGSTDSVRTQNHDASPDVFRFRAEHESRVYCCLPTRSGPTGSCGRLMRCSGDRRKQRRQDGTSNQPGAQSASFRSAMLAVRIYGNGAQEWSSLGY
jgi:hypothetical protein